MTAANDVIESSGFEKNPQKSAGHQKDTDGPGQQGSRTRLNPTAEADDSEKTRKSAGQPEQATPGNPPDGGSTLGREALYDGASSEQYAEIIADVIRNGVSDVATASNGFCFAILGPWGRGKTWLASCIERNLKLEISNGSRTSWGGKFQIVNFSAWRYRSQAETWAGLYETIRLSAIENSWFLSLRVLQHRFGLWPFTGFLSSLSVMIFLLQGITDVTHLIAGLGIATLISLIGDVSGMLVSGASSLRKIHNRFVGGTAHSDKLGLQHTIGVDLQCLIQGWSGGVFSRGMGDSLSCWQKYGDRLTDIVAFVLSAFVLEGMQYQAGQKFFSQAVEWDWLHPVALFGLLLVAASPFGMLYLLFCRGSTQKVALVIDDLDRSSPDRILQIVEDIKLFVDQPKIRKRLSVLMLLEEDTLKLALRSKYTGLVTQSELTDSAKNSFYTGQFQKLFDGWMRLGNLQQKEREAIVRGIRQEKGSSGNSDETGAVTPVSNTGPLHVTNAAVAAVDLEPVLCWIASVEKNGPAGQLLQTPRAIRSFVARYRIAVLLFMLSDKDWDPTKYGNKLCEEIIGCESADAGVTELSGASDVARLLAKVARNVY